LFDHPLPAKTLLLRGPFRVIALCMNGEWHVQTLFLFWA
jgi:hypothetical protein